VLDIDAIDLQQLFSILDADGSGKIDLGEFIEAMYRTKHQDAKTATTFVKHMCEGMEKKQNRIDEQIHQLRSCAMRKEPTTKRMTDSELLKMQEALLHTTIEKAMSMARQVVVEAAIQGTLPTAMDATFNQIDTNHDGVITRAEFEGHQARASSKGTTSTDGTGYGLSKKIDDFTLPTLLGQDDQQRIDCKTLIADVSNNNVAIEAAHQMKTDPPDTPEQDHQSRRLEIAAVASGSYEELRPPDVINLPTISRPARIPVICRM